MSGRIEINGARPPANAAAQPALARRAAPPRSRGVFAASSIRSAQGGQPARRRNPGGGQNFSCCDCIMVLLRAIFRCLFCWCLPARPPQAGQNPARPAAQPGAANPGNNAAAAVQNPAPPAINVDHERVRLFLEQFPQPQGDQEERCEDFVAQFKEQIPLTIQKSARAAVVRAHRGQITYVQELHTNPRDDHKGPARQAMQVTDDEAALILMETEANVVATVREFLEESIGIHRQEDDE